MITGRKLGAEVHTARTTRPGRRSNKCQDVGSAWCGSRPQSAELDKLAPHDLRRTCARLCHLAGGELDQIQFLLGHASIQTTERYLGCNQELRVAVNDRLGIEPDSA